jgi:hypothetical protein
MTQIDRVIKRTGELTDAQVKSTKKMTKGERMVAQAYRGRADALAGSLLKVQRQLISEENKLIVTDNQRAKSEVRRRAMHDRMADTISQLVVLNREWVKSQNQAARAAINVADATRKEASAHQQLSRAQQASLKLRVAERLKTMPGGGGIAGLAGAERAIKANMGGFYMDKVVPKGYMEMIAGVARNTTKQAEAAKSAAKAHQLWARGMRVTNREMERLNSLGKRGVIPTTMVGRAEKFGAALTGMTTKAAKGASALYSMGTRLSWHLFLFEQGARQLALFAGGIANLAKEGAKIRTMEDSFERLNQVAGRVDMSAMREALKGTVTDVKIMEMANLARQLQIGAEDIPKLAAVAKAAAQSLGLDTEQMYSDIIRGTARYSKKILDNLGIRMENLASLWKRSAQKMGKSVQELTEEEKNRVFVNQVLANSDKILAAAGEDHAGAYERQAVTIDNLVDKGKKWFDQVIRNSGMLEFFGDMVDSVSGFLADNEDSMKRFVDSLVSVARTAGNVAEGLMNLGSVALPFLSRSLQGTVESLEIFAMAGNAILAPLGGSEEGVDDLAESLAKATHPAYAFAENMKDIARSINDADNAREIFIRNLSKGADMSKSQFFMGLEQATEAERQATLQRFRELGNEQLVKELENYYKSLGEKQAAAAESARKEAVNANLKLAGDILKMPSGWKPDRIGGGQFESIMDLALVPERNMGNMAKKYVDQVEHLLGDLEDGKRDLTDGFGDLTDDQIKDMETQVYAANEQFRQLMEDWQGAPDKAAKEEVVAAFMMQTFGDPRDFVGTEAWNEYQRIYEASVNEGFFHWVKVTDAILDEFAKRTKKPPKRGRRRKPKAKQVGKMVEIPEVGQFIGFATTQTQEMLKAKAALNEYYTGYFDVIEGFSEFQFQAMKLAKSDLEKQKAREMIERRRLMMEDEIVAGMAENSKKLKATLGKAQVAYNATLDTWDQFTFENGVAKMKSAGERREEQIKLFQAEVRKNIEEIDGAIRELKRAGGDVLELEMRRRDLVRQMENAAKGMETTAETTGMARGIAGGISGVRESAHKGADTGMEFVQSYIEEYREAIQYMEDLTFDSMEMITDHGMQNLFKSAVIDPEGMDMFKEKMADILGQNIQGWADTVSSLTRKGIADAVGGMTGIALGGLGGGIIGGIVSGLGSFVSRLFERDKRKEKKTDEAIKKIAEKKRDITVNLDLIHHGLNIDDRTSRQVAGHVRRAVELGERI